MNAQINEEITMLNIDQARQDIMAIFNDDSADMSRGNSATVSLGDVNIAIKAIVNQDYSIWYDWFVGDTGYTKMNDIDNVVCKYIK